MQSIHGFCKTHNLSKTTVHRWLKDQGFDTSQGMDDAAIAAATAEFVPVPVATEAAPLGTTTEFTTGNHRGHLALPSQPAAVDLAMYRGEDAALSSFEPEDIERFLEACDGFVAAVDADYEHQKAVTAQKEAAAAKVKAKVDAVKQAQMVYQMRSESLALHNRGLDAELKEGMQALGKPAATGQ